MKRIILLSLLFTWCSSSFAQKVQFTDDTNVWCMIDSTTGCCILRPVNYTNTHYDTAIVNYNGYTYKHIKSSMESFLVRENGGKVYVIGTADSVERVLYDFNLGVNDTLRTIYPEDKYITWVTQIDSTQFGGNWYKVWHFEGIDTIMYYYPDSVKHINYNVIEGIGCTNGPYYPACPYDRVGFSQQLLCFKNDLNIITSLSNPVVSFGYDYIQYYDNGASCTDFEYHTPVVMPSGTKQLSQISNSAIVIPNPINETARIVFPGSVISGTLVVVNNVGQVIVKASFQNKDAITIGDKVNVPGIYFYRVTDNATGKVFEGKFVY